MINLNSVTEEKNGRTRYALPGGAMTDRAYYALDVLMEISDLAAKTIEAQKARKSGTEIGNEDKERRGNHAQSERQYTIFSGGLT